MSQPSLVSTGAPAPDAAHRSDWRSEIPEARRRSLRVWLWSVAATTLAVLVVGGITRLTQSGLSIVDWRPFMGVLPPLDEGQWVETFERYRQFPEYQVLRRGMSLEEFKLIFFWEYLHRLLARGIGVVFLVPFVYFWLRGHLNRPLLSRALLLFGLGAMQGVMGWIMVRSGLVDRPYVSHYRLAAHLGLAFVIFGFAVWLARELRSDAARSVVEPGALRLMRRGLAALGALLALQVLWGALVAGLKAGFLFNTFPLMGGGLVPPGFAPGLVDLVQDPAVVQWMHRVLGTLLGVVAIVFFVRVSRARTDVASRRLNAALLALILGQYLLGVLTLLFLVPVSLAVLHQATAMVIFGVWVWWWHHAWNLEVPATPAALAPAGASGRG